MTATNIDIEQFIEVLVKLHETGVRIIDLDMVQDDSHPSMNKLIVYPKKMKDGEKIKGKKNNRLSVRNPEISTENDDIFDALNDI